jgi:outer membrane lipoprotein-sorting protein
MLSPAAADSRLAPMSPDQLMDAVTSARVPGFSGTVAEMSSLELPELGDTSAEPLLALTSGSHSLRVWYAGETQQRVAMVDKSGEFDVFHNGSDVWQWDSAKQEATHAVESSAAATTPSGTTDPQELAKQLLADVGSSTSVTSGPEQRVAGRPAYQLVLTPKQAGSRISSVTLSIDGQTHIPLGVQVYGTTKSSAPVIDVSYLDVDFAVPAASMFTFTPPASAKVTQRSASDSSVLDSVKTIGTGWTTVFELADASKVLGGATSLAAQLLPEVQGSWGSGHLIDSTMMSALITDDGRVFCGAVDPAVLYAAAAAN